MRDASGGRPLPPPAQLPYVNEAESKQANSNAWINITTHSAARNILPVLPCVALQFARPTPFSAWTLRGDSPGSAVQLRDDVSPRRDSTG